MVVPAAAGGEVAVALVVVVDRRPTKGPQVSSSRGLDRARRKARSSRERREESEGRPGVPRNAKKNQKEGSALGVNENVKDS